MWLIVYDNKGFSSAAVKALLRHSCEEPTARSFFDDAVSSNTKRKMTSALKKQDI